MKFTSVGKCLLCLLFLLVGLNYFSGGFLQEGLKGSKLDAKMGSGVTLAGGGQPWDMRNLGKGRPMGKKTSSVQGPPYDRMAIFDGVSFSPTCCPSTYSNSVGCACSDAKMEEYVAVLRGGNNTKACNTV